MSDRSSKVPVAMPVEFVIEQEELEDGTTIRRGEVTYVSTDGDKYAAQFPLSPDKRTAGAQMSYMLGQRELRDSEEDVD